MALYIKNQGKVLLKYVLQAEMFLTGKSEFSSLWKAWIHLEYSFIQNNLYQIGGKFESWGDTKVKFKSYLCTAWKKGKGSLREQNCAGRKNENADFVKGIGKKSVLCNQTSKWIIITET